MAERGKDRADDTVENGILDEGGMEGVDDLDEPRHEPAHSTLGQPRGILRKPTSGDRDGPGKITWNEASLAQQAEWQKAHPHEKIDEPKTPWPETFDPSANGLAKTDDIAPLSLASPTSSVSPLSSRHSSFSNPSGSQGGSRRPSGSSSRRSSSSSDKRVTLSAGDAAVAQDERNNSPESQEKHQKFNKSRKEHYKDEGAALRNLQASAIADDDDDDDDNDDGANGNNGRRHVPPVPPMPRVPNGFSNK